MGGTWAYELYMLGTACGRALWPLHSQSQQNGGPRGVWRARYTPKGRIAACGSTKTGSHVETFRAGNGSHVMKRSCSHQAKPERGIAYGLPKAARRRAKEDEI